MLISFEIQNNLRWIWIRKSRLEKMLYEMAQMGYPPQHLIIILSWWIYIYEIRYILPQYWLLSLLTIIFLDIFLDIF